MEEKPHRYDTDSDSHNKANYGKSLFPGKQHVFHFLDRHIFPLLPLLFAWPSHCARSSLQGCFDTMLSGQFIYTRCSTERFGTASLPTLTLITLVFHHIILQLLGQCPALTANVGIGG